MKVIIIAILAIMLSIPLNSYAQSDEDIEIIEGEYSDEELGLSFILPEGWQGAQLPYVSISMPRLFSTSIIAATPVNIENYEGTTAVLIMAARAHTESESKSKIDEVRETSDPVEKTKNQECKVLSYEYVTLGDSEGAEVIMECSKEDDEGNPITIKDKSIFAYRNQPLQKFIGIRLVSESSEYDKYIQDFNKIVNTLRFDGDEIRYSHLPNNITEKVMLDNQERVVSMRSNSEINKFRFDKNDKSITFDAIGKNDTVGLTEIYLSDVLEGPYTVMIDGEPTRVLNITEGDREG
ncbi:MAG: hypothetical protein D6752_03130, partial [Candidatus Nitrosothermus koennekii]